ncbi:DNA repair protein RadC [Bradyrhizobium sp. AZCC 1588]
MARSNHTKGRLKWGGLLLVRIRPAGGVVYAKRLVARHTIPIAAPLGISVRDHIVVGGNGHASLRGLKLI